MSERLRDRLIEAIAEWNNEFGEGQNISVGADVVLSATVETLADFLLAIPDQLVRTEASRRVHVYLDMCLAGYPSSFPAIKFVSSH